MKKKIFDVPIFFADQIFLFLPVIVSQNLCKIISSVAYLFTTAVILGKEKNTEEVIENSLADLGISLWERVSVSESSRHR